MAVASSLFVLAGCGGPNTPTTTTTTTTVPAVTNPPQLTCPAPQTIQSFAGIPVPVSYGTATAANGSPPVVTVCTPPSGSIFNVGLSTVTCTATDAMQRTDTCNFSVNVLAPPRLSVIKFLAFGDSITKGEDGSAGLSASSSRFQPSVLLPNAQTYPGVLQQNLVDRYTAQMPTVFNGGCQGEGLTGDDSPCGFSRALGRFTSFTSTGLFPAVLIMEGTNDLYGQKDASNVGPALNGLRQMVGDARSRGMQVYLATIPPIDPLGSRGRTFGSQLVPQLNDGIRGLASSTGATLVDVNQVFGNSFALLGPDGLHPSAAGYVKIADAFFQAIRSTLETTQTTSFGPVDFRRSFLRMR